MSEKESERVVMDRYRMAFSFRRRVSRSIGGNVALFSIILLFALFRAPSSVYVLINAFKPVEELFLYPPRFFVVHPTLDNFLALTRILQSTSVHISRYAFNSACVAVLGTASYILIASLAAYPLARHRFAGRGLYSAVIIWAILFRPEVMGIPQYLVVAGLGMIDTHAAILLPALGGTFGVFMMKQFMATLPEAMMQAARMDGASEYRIFFAIVMPQVRPAWLTLTIFTFQGFWNSAGTGVSYIFSEPMKLLPTALEQISAAGLARAGAGAAIALMMLIPPVAVYLVCQGSIMETMAHTGIK